MDPTAFSIFSTQNTDDLHNIEVQTLRNELDALSNEQETVIWKALMNPEWFINDPILIKKVIKSIPNTIPNDVWDYFSKRLLLNLADKIDEDLMKKNQFIYSGIVQIHKTDKELSSS
jgi:hypothetical protein